MTLSRIRVDDHGTQARLSRAGAILNEESNAAFQVIVVSGQRHARLRAPVDKNRLRTNIRTDVTGNIQTTLQGVVGSNVTERGFPYPKYLDESDRTHYRRGPMSGRGTKDYFTGVLRLAAQMRAVRDAVLRSANRVADRLNG